MNKNNNLPNQTNRHSLSLMGEHKMKHDQSDMHFTPLVYITVKKYHSSNVYI